MRSWLTASEEETLAVGREIGELLRPEATALVSGRLGAGKTVLAKGVASALDIDPSHVQSPTFTLMREHQGAGGSLVHVDLYRLDPHEIQGAGIDEALSGPGVKLVEWPERLGFVPSGAVEIAVHVLEDGQRRIELRDSRNQQSSAGEPRHGGE